MPAPSSDSKTNADADADAAKAIEAIRRALPGNLFGAETPPLTPRPLPLSGKQVDELEKLGHRLFLFHEALDRIRKRSRRGKLPAWIASGLDDAPSAATPGLFCPSLILTASGWSLTGYSRPGTILPVTAALNRIHASLGNDAIVAGPDWDALDNPQANGSAPPLTALALLHLRALHEVWRREIRESQLHRLQAIIPYTWLMDPAPLPPHAVIPHLELNSMQALAGLPREDRAGLILKGPEGTLHGRDAADDEWRAAVTEVLEREDGSPPRTLLQERVEPATMPHPVWHPDTGKVATLEARVRLNPVYITRDDTATLEGIVASLESGDDIILAPCSLA